MFNDWNDRCISEREWIESQELMLEFGLPDYDAQVKQHQIEILEAGLAVVQDSGELESEIPF